ncbi:DUF2797 domain-containing protein [Methylothermus subterraneus]
MHYRGVLRKMHVALSDEGVAEYRLPVGEDQLPLGACLGKALTLTYQGQIYCIHCGRKTYKSFNQGYCFPCFRRLARCDRCIVKPELCHYAQGTCREPEWAKEHCFAPHVVYLANSSGLKVGITRKTQIPTRWLDQGASQALPILEVSSRHLAGLVEAILKRWVGDRTHWHKMLKAEGPALDLSAERERLLALGWEELKELRKRFGSHAANALQAEALSIRYPVLAYPAKVRGFDFDKQPEAGGILLGIKGQYLIFDRGVINIRKFAGYLVELKS